MPFRTRASQSELAITVDHEKLKELSGSETIQISYPWAVGAGFLSIPQLV